MKDKFDPPKPDGAYRVGFGVMPIYEVPDFPEDKALLVSSPGPGDGGDSWRQRCGLIKNILRPGVPKLKDMMAEDAADYIRNAVNDIAANTEDCLVPSLPFKELRLSKRTIRALEVTMKPPAVKRGGGVVFVDHDYNTLPVIEVSEEEEDKFLKELAVYGHNRVLEVR